MTGTEISELIETHWIKFSGELEAEFANNERYDCKRRREHDNCSTMDDLEYIFSFSLEKISDCPELYTECNYFYFF